ncbi:MAG: hypothetical protein QXD43_01990 [Candidatus Aenigmatarchaeota archaeon]
MKKTGFYKSCNTCNKKIYVSLWIYKSRRNKKIFYCNKKCFLNRPSVFHKCKTCGKIFRRRESKVKESKYGLLYCSRRCRYLDPESFDAIRTGKFVKCANCGKLVYTIPHIDKRSKYRYCSIKCRSSDKKYIKLLKETRNRKGKLINCFVCGKRIYKPLCEIVRSEKHYCSDKCRFIGQRGKISPKRNGKIVKCFNCGKEIYRALWRLNGYKTYFCSMKCLNQHSKYNMLYITKPTRLEKLFIKLIKKYNLPYKYVGNGSFWVKNANPDFINVNGKKEVIEIFGDFWHNPKLNKYCNYEHTEKGRKLIFKKYGFNCIVIWEKEFNNPNWEENVLNILGVKNGV